jgi:hypothetical protein
VSAFEKSSSIWKTGLVWRGVEFPKWVDVVEKVEIRMAPKISRKSIFEHPHYFAKFKHLSRKAAARSSETIYVTIGEILRAFRPTECATGYAQS